MDTVSGHNHGNKRPGTIAGRLSAVSGAAPLKSLLPLPIALYLLIVITPVRFNLGPLLMTGLRLYLILLIIPLVFRLLSGRMGGIFAIDVLFILHIIWMTIALSMNNPDMVVTQFGSVGVEFLGGYLLARAYIRTPESFSALCRWIVMIVVFTAPFAVIESINGRPIIIETINRIPGLFSVSDVQNPPRMGLERAQVVFAHPIHYGLFCSVAMSLCFVALRDQISDFWRYMFSGIILISGFLALSSGALLAIVLQLCLIIWAVLFKGLRWRWWLLVGLFAIAYIIVEVLSNRSAIIVLLSYASFSAHNAYWRSIIFEWGMVNVWANPVFGIGLNDWVRPWYMFSGSMDNFWLVMAVRYGIP
ncbi:O-antigen ligase family protein, partial [Roseovarius autotrophicus]|uniref:O-antigen ligase family protein n=1 Tax=Roseovarius autotrophicus TaxID=2824121 RepID=UPI001B35EB5D